MALVPAVLSLNWVSNYIGPHRVCYRIVGAPTFTCTVPGSPGLEGDAALRGAYNTLYFNFCYPTNRRVTYKIPIDKDINVESAIGSTLSSVPVTAPHQNACAVGANENPITIQFLDQRTDDDNDAVRSSNPAIFETEPKESIDLDLFYSTGSIFPTKFNIETAEQLDFMHANNCDHIQGYYFSRPLSAEHMTALLAQHGLKFFAGIDQ